MNVNFDGLRKFLISDYNSLVRTLNIGISSSGSVCVDADDIQRQLDGIRQAIVTLAFMYQDGEDGFQSFDENTNFESFNSEQ